MPIIPHKLLPEIKDTYWVNLIGQRLPRPAKALSLVYRADEDLPSNKFIRDVVRHTARPSWCWAPGRRKASSARPTWRGEENRSRRFARPRDRLTPNAKLPNSLVYTPIEDWSNDDVWVFLMQVKNPWGYTNKSLLTMYQGAIRRRRMPACRR